MFLSLLLGIVTEAIDFHEIISSSDITIILDSKYPSTRILPFSNSVSSPSSSSGSAVRPEKFTKVIKSAVREEGREGRKEGGKEGEKLKTVELSPFHNKRRKFYLKSPSQSILSSSQNKDGDGMSASMSPSIVESSLRGDVPYSSSASSSSSSCFSSSSYPLSSRQQSTVTSATTLPQSRNSTPKSFSSSSTSSSLFPATSVLVCQSIKISNSSSVLVPLDCSERTNSIDQPRNESRSSSLIRCRVLSKSDDMIGIIIPQPQYRGSYRANKMLLAAQKKKWGEEGGSTYSYPRVVEWWF